MKYLRKTFGIALIIGYVFLSIDGQTSDFAALPDKMKHSFFSRFDDVVKYEKEQDWKSLYPLSLDSLSDREFLSGEKLNEDEFVKRRANSVEVDGRLIEFGLIGVTLLNGGDNYKEWLVEGCSKIKTGKTNRSVRTGITAIYYNDCWYFSDSNVFLKGIGAADQEVRCEIPKKHRDGDSR